MSRHEKPIREWDIDDIEEHLNDYEPYLDENGKLSHSNALDLLQIAKRATVLFRRRELNDAPG